MTVLRLIEAEFPPATRPVAPPPPPVDPEPIRKKHQQQALAGVGLFARKERAAAKQAGSTAAEAELAEIAAKDAALHASYQQELDAYWEKLQQGDPDTVMAALAEAFEDNDAAAAPLGVHGTEASLVVLVPTEDAVPKSKPATTSAGNPTVKNLTQREQTDLYKLLVCGYVLVTVKEAFAVAPSVDTVRIVAVRGPGKDVYGKRRVEPMIASCFSRSALTGVRWSDVDAVQVWNETAQERVFQQSGRNKQFVPIDLSQEPELAEVVAAIDLEELLD